MKTANSIRRLLGLFALCAMSGLDARGGQFAKDVVIEKDISYVDHGNPRQTFDLFRPPDAKGKRLPLVVWMHGGAWEVGDKDWDNVKYLVGHGFALASVDYRLSGDAVFPAQIQDCNAALNFLLAHADTYGFDTNRVVIGGASAGGHLALLLGLARKKEFGATDFRPRAVLDFFGPTDLSSNTDHVVTKLLGASVTDRPDLARNASPVTYVGPENPPVLLLHGGKDDLVSTDQSRLMYAALNKAGVKSELIIVNDAPHDGPLFGTPDIQEKVLAFLHGVLGP